MSDKKPMPRIEVYNKLAAAHNSGTGNKESFKRPVPPPPPNVAATPMPPVQTPGEKAAELSPVELPSNFIPYDFKTLYVRPIRGIHQSKFTLSAKKQSVRILVETVSSLLEGTSAFDLTVADFRWLLYYLRKVNYVRVPLTVTAYCSNEDHLKRVQKEEVHADTLKNIGSLNQSILDERALDQELLNSTIAQDEILQKMPLGWQTMRDLVEIVERSDATEEDIDDWVWLAEMASFVKKDQGGQTLTLQQRIDYVAQLSPEETTSLAKYAQLSGDYGVSEFIRMRCKECGAEILEPFQLSARNFL